MKFPTSWSLRKQFIVFFVGCAVISLVVVFVVTVICITQLGENSRSLATNALEDQIKVNLILASQSTGDVISHKFMRAGISVVSTLSRQLEFTLAPSYPLPYMPSYFDGDEAYGKETPEHSVFYLPLSTLDGSNLPELITAQVNDTIQRSSSLDIFFRDIFAQYDQLAALYVGFEQGGLFRRYPGKIVDGTRQYDPRTRPWYTAAKKAAGTLIYTAPYLDAFGKGWMISVAQSITSPTTGVMVGVVSADLTISAIQQNVLDITFLDTGYATLVQKEDSIVVASPLWDTSKATTTSTVTLKDIQQLDHLDTILSDTAGLVTGEVNGIQSFIAHTPVQPKYVLIITVAEHDAVKSVGVLRTEIESTQSTVFAATISSSIITLVVTTLFIFLFGKSIEKRLERIANLANQITKNAAEDDMTNDVEMKDFDNEKNDEISVLSKAFENMASKLKKEEAQEKSTFPPNPFFNNPNNPWLPYSNNNNRNSTIKET